VRNRGFAGGPSKVTFPTNGASVSRGFCRLGCWSSLRSWSGSSASVQRGPQPYVGVARAASREGGQFLRLAALVFSLLLNGGRLLDKSHAAARLAAGCKTQFSSVQERARLAERRPGSRLFSFATRSTEVSPAVNVADPCRRSEGEEGFLGKISVICTTAPYLWPSDRDQRCKHTPNPSALCPKRRGSYVGGTHS